jgi:NitT/TauT family transport system substrate-binding protein
MDAWFGQISIFMRGTGAIQTVPQSTDFITDIYMKRVAADPKLRDFANNAK